MYIKYLCLGREKGREKGTENGKGKGKREETPWGTERSGCAHLILFVFVHFSASSASLDVSIVGIGTYGLAKASNPLVHHQKE